MNRTDTADQDNSHEPQGPEPGKVFGADGGQVADPESAGDPANETGHKKGQQFVLDDIDAHYFGRDVVIADRNPGAPHARAQQIHHTDDAHDGEKEC